MSNSLTNWEIKKRLIRLTNLEKLHSAQLKRNKKLLQENKRFKERVTILETSDKEKNKIIETLKLQIEELQRIVFGKKNKNQNNKSDKNTDIDSKDKRNKENNERTVDSYKRKTPKEEEITNKEERKINICPDCETPLSKKETKIF